MSEETLPPVVAELDANADDFHEVVDRVKEELLALDDSESNPNVGLNTEDFDLKDDLVRATLEELGLDHADPSVHLGTADFMAKYAEIEADLAVLDAEEVTIGTDNSGLTDFAAGLSAAAAGLVEAMVGTQELEGALTDAEVLAAAVTQTFDDLDVGVIDLATGIADLEEAGLNAELAFQLLEGAGVDVEGAIQDAEMAVADLTGALSDLEGAVTDGEALIQIFETGLNDAGTAAGGLMTELASLAEEAPAAIGDIFPMAAMIFLIGGAILALIPIVGALVGVLGGLSAIGFIAFAGIGSFALAVIPIFMQVTTAMQNIASLQRGIATATTAAAKATAESKLDAYLASLSPLLRTVIGDVDQAKQVLSNWDSIMAPTVLGFINAALADLAPLLTAITPLAQATGAVLTSIVSQLGTDFKSTAFSNFITWLVVNVGPALNTIATFVENVASGLAGMAQTGGPFIAMLEQGIGSLGHDIANFGTSNTFKDFINWLTTNGPTIGRDLETIGHSVGTIITALAPAGLIALKLFTDEMSGLAIIISGLPGDLRTLESGWSATMGLLKSTFDAFWNSVKGPLGDVATGIGNITSPLKSLSSLWSSTFGGMGGAVSAAYSAIAPVLGSIAGALGSVAGAASALANNLNTLRSLPVIGGLFGSSPQPVGQKITTTVPAGLGAPPGHADGALVTSPHLAWVGEAGRELILPESKVPGGFDALPAALGGSSVGTAGLTGGGGSFTVGQVVVNGAQDPQSTARAVRDELLNMGRNYGTGGVFGSYGGSR